MLAPTPASILNQKIRPLGIPFPDSAYKDRALAESYNLRVIIVPNDMPEPCRREVMTLFDPAQ